ncbi:adenosinetriphosphatase [Puccinia sorghi]|uniref:Adenosinetriphosphatase n=1 Tax=Puccinia sorghi TaxID=27349 RepID=A0A0L6USH1_9BASI|nr:adenosinetriphosphatase [Puccinia sorghi]
MPTGSSVYILLTPGLPVDTRPQFASLGTQSTVFTESYQVFPDQLMSGMLSKKADRRFGSTLLVKESVKANKLPASIARFTLNTWALYHKKRERETKRKADKEGIERAKKEDEMMEVKHQA